jgi:FkbM family methyltransferase
MAQQQLQKLFDSSDFQSNPFKALIKRLWWRLWWQLTNRPLLVPFAKTLKINVPKTGSGAGIYYRGFSEPDTADFFYRFLRPGMVMFDVGAHIGEYTLLAAKLLGASGQVHAFEPQAHIFPILTQSVCKNGFDRVVLNCTAVSDLVGEIEFQVLSEPSMSSIRRQSSSTETEKIVSVPCTSLDRYWGDRQEKIDLIKVDVEGAEKFVFQGATNLLGLPQDRAPTWVFEYAPVGYADFGYESEDILTFLKEYKYEIFKYCGNGQIEQFTPSTQVEDIVNLIATKNLVNLLDLLKDIES